MSRIFATTVHRTKCGFDFRECIDVSVHLYLANDSAHIYIYRLWLQYQISVLPYTMRIFTFNSSKNIVFNIGANVTNTWTCTWAALWILNEMKWKRQCYAVSPSFDNRHSSIHHLIFAYGEDFICIESTPQIFNIHNSQGQLCVCIMRKKNLRIL